MKKFVFTVTALVLFLSLVLATSAFAAAKKTKITRDTVYQASEYSRVEVYYPDDPAHPDIFVLEPGDPAVTVYQGSEVILTKRAKTKTVQRATWNGSATRRVTRETPTPEVTTTQSGSDYDRLLAQYSRGSGNTTTTGNGVTITGNGSAAATTPLVTSNVDGGGFIGKEATAPTGLKAEIRKYGFQVVDVDPSDERLAWAVNFCRTVDPGAKVYATSEGCLVVWHANSGLISGAKKCTLDRNAPVSVDYDAGGRGGHAEPGQSFRYTGRITVRY